MSLHTLRVNGDVAVDPAVDALGVLSDAMNRLGENESEEDRENEAQQGQIPTHG